MRTLIYIVVLVCQSLWCFAQSTDEYDGLAITASTINDDVFYYGEQIFFYFKVTNTRDEANSYFTPSSNTNYRFLLKNLSTGKIKKSERWDSHIRGAQENAVPLPTQSYQPNETVIVQALLNSIFADEKLYKELVYSYKIANKLLAIDVGTYQLTVEYQLLPSDKTISTHHSFEVKPVPTEQQAAFDQYVKATTYAGHSYRRGGGNYSATHPDSYENFLEKHFKSPYSDYAFIDMVSQVYIYPVLGKEASITKFNQYIEYFSKIKRSSLKMHYITYLPSLISNIPDKDLKSELDRFLREELADQDSDFSTALIDISKWRYQLEGLRSYATPGIR